MNVEDYVQEAVAESEDVTHRNLSYVRGCETDDALYVEAGLGIRNGGTEAAIRVLAGLSLIAGEYDGTVHLALTGDKLHRVTLDGEEDLSPDLLRQRVVNDLQVD